MPKDIEVSSLYNGKINLWVEDSLTREYLDGVWQDTSIKYLIAGGHEGIRSVVKDAEEAKYRNVFGLTDRDFRPSNHPDWSNPTKTFRTFVLPVHEIENYLLDAESLSGCQLNNIRRTQSEVEQLMVDRASLLCWWAACRKVIGELRSRFRTSFLNDPKCPQVTDLAQAHGHICKSDWFRHLATHTAQSTEQDIEKMLGEAHREACGQIESGAWKVDFPGKELFRDIRSRVHDAQKLKGPPPTTGDLDIAVAKSVAKWQAEKQKVPSELIELRQALKDRIARI